MEITYLGHSTFRIKSKNAQIVTDPYDPTVVGLRLPKLEADIITISHHHPDHDFINGIKGREKEDTTANLPFVVDGPGEYEIKGINILGLATYHDDKNGEERGKNVVYSIRAENLNVVHCGDLGHKLSDNQLEELGDVDVLLVPVGGNYTLGPQQAEEVITAIGPKIVIPMHYKPAGVETDLKIGTLEDFLKIIGKTDLVPVDKLVLSRDKLPEETQTIVLKI